MIHNSMKSVLALAATTLLAFGAQAAPVADTWIGGESGNVADTANWEKATGFSWNGSATITNNATLQFDALKDNCKAYINNGSTVTFSGNGKNSGLNQFGGKASGPGGIFGDGKLRLENIRILNRGGNNYETLNITVPEIEIVDGGTVWLDAVKASVDRAYVTSSITGGGDVIVVNNSSYASGWWLTGDNSGFTGTWTIQSVTERMKMRWLSETSGSAAAKWSIGAGSSRACGVFLENGGTLKFGELTGTGMLTNGYPEVSTTLEVGALGTDFACGVNVDGMNVRKVGSGTMTWSGSNAAMITISEGTVALAAGAVVDCPIIDDGGSLTVDLSSVKTRNLPVTVLTLASPETLDLSSLPLTGVPDGYTAMRDVSDPSKLVVTIAPSDAYVWTGNGSDDKWSTPGNWKLADGSDVTAYPTGAKTVIFPQTMAKAEVTLDASEGTDKNKYILASGTVAFNCATTLIGTSNKVHLRPLTVLGSGTISLKNACFQTVNYKTFTINNDLDILPTDGDDPWADYSELYIRGKGGNYVLNGKLSGSGRLKFITDGNDNEQCAINGDASDFTGKLYLNRKTVLGKDVLDFAQATIEIDDGTDGLQVPSDATASVLKIGQLTGDGVLKKNTASVFTLEVGSSADASYAGTLTGSAVWTIRKVGTGRQSFTNAAMTNNIDLVAGELKLPENTVAGTVTYEGGTFVFDYNANWTVDAPTNVLTMTSSTGTIGTDAVLLEGAIPAAYNWTASNADPTALAVTVVNATYVWSNKGGDSLWSNVNNWEQSDGSPVRVVPDATASVTIGDNKSVVVEAGQVFGAIAIGEGSKLIVPMTANGTFTLSLPDGFDTAKVASFAPFDVTYDSGKNQFTATRGPATFTWAGTNGAWTDAANWQIAGGKTLVWPTANDQAVFNEIIGVSPIAVTLSSDVAVSNLTFNADVFLTGLGHNLNNIIDIDGTGKIVMSNMTLKTYCTFEMDNDIEIAAGSTNVLYVQGNGKSEGRKVTLNGNLLGSGYVQFQTYRRNAGFYLKGDNTAFCGTAEIWDDNTKDNCWRGETVFFNDKASGANAIWNIVQKGGTGWDGSDNTGSLLYYDAGTNRFGALNGPIASQHTLNKAAIYNKTWEIGSRNEDCACRINGVSSSRNFDLLKVGTAKLTFIGQSFSDYIIRNGTLELDTVNAVPGGEVRFIGTGDEHGFVSFTESFTNAVDNAIYDLSGKIANSTAAIGIDTAGFDVTWETAVKSSNVGGLTKKGEGTLTIKSVALNGALQVLGGKIAISDAVTAGGQELLSWDVVDGAQEVTLADFALADVPAVGYALVTNAARVALVTQRMPADYGYAGATDGLWTDVANWTVSESSTPFYPDSGDTATIGAEVTVTAAVGQVVKTLTIGATSKLAFDLAGVTTFNAPVTLFSVTEGTCPLTADNVLLKYDTAKYALVVTPGATAFAVTLYEKSKFVWTGNGGDGIFKTPGNWAYGVAEGPTAETAPTGNSTVTFPASFTDGVTVTFDGDATDKGISFVLGCDVTFAADGTTTRTIYPWSITGEGTLSLANYINVQTVTGKDMTVDVDVNVLPSVGDDPWAAYAQFYLRGEKTGITFSRAIKGTGCLYLGGDGNQKKSYYVNGDASGFSGKIYTQYSWSGKSNDEANTIRLGSAAALSLGSATLEVVGRVWVLAVNDTATLSVGALYGTGVINNYNNTAMTLEVGSLDADASASVTLTNNYDVGAWTVRKVGTGRQSLADATVAYNVDLTAGELDVPAGKTFGSVALGGGKFNFAIPYDEPWTNGTAQTLFTCASGVTEGTEVDYVTLDLSAFEAVYEYEFDNTEANTLKVTLTPSASTFVWEGPNCGLWSDAANWVVKGTSEHPPVAPGAGSRVEIGANAVILVDPDQGFGTVTADASAKLAVLFAEDGQKFAAPTAFAGTIMAAGPFEMDAEGVATRVPSTFAWTDAVADHEWNTLGNWKVGDFPTAVLPHINDIAEFPAQDGGWTLSVNGSEASPSNIVFAADVTLCNCTSYLRPRFVIGGEGVMTLGDNAMIASYQVGLSVSNDLVVTASDEQPAQLYITDSNRSITLFGDVTGGGTLKSTCAKNANYSGTHFLGDLRAFTGRFVAPANSADRNQTQFEGEYSWSENAHFELSAGGGTTCALTGKTFKFGAFSGKMNFADQSVKNMTIEVGNLNAGDDNIAGTFFASQYPNLTAERGHTIRKVGTGTLEVSVINNKAYEVNGGVMRLMNDRTVRTMWKPNGKSYLIVTDPAEATGSNDVSIAFTGTGTLALRDAVTLDISGLIANSSGAVAIDDEGVDRTWATALAASNAGGFTKKGAGTLTLTAAPAYTGPTRIEGGKLVVNGALNLEAGSAVVVADPAAALAAGTVFIEATAITGKPTLLSSAPDAAQYRLKVYKAGDVYQLRLRRRRGTMIRLR